ncbi:hypothetical protein Tco_0600338 [Tanacetum coccineum]|uniref:Uncharacterized protein n=1 Tax=Tanacetum coccineum TaxID=301880 RepID=A0ABQ4WBL2_9ASTR
MNSQSKRYEKLKTIPDELGIRSNLCAPGQVLSITSGRKRKIQELEHEARIPGLECNRSLHEGVPFVNNMVIEEPDYGMFFIDVFGDELKLRKLIGSHPDQDKLKSKKVKLESVGYKLD